MTSYSFGYLVNLRPPHVWGEITFGGIYENGVYAIREMVKEPYKASGYLYAAVGVG